MSTLLNFLTSHEERFRKGRLVALYSDFRHLRTTNPDGYLANISAWQKALTDATRNGYISSRGNKVDILVLPVHDDLLGDLETKEWGRPLSLGAVINDLIARKELIPLQEFLDAKQSIYQRPRVVSQLFYWSLRQLGFSGAQNEDDKLPLGNFVVIANVELATKEASSRLATKTTRVDRIYSKALFSEEFTDCLRELDRNSPSLSSTDLDILLKHLARDKQLIGYDGHTIKVKAPGGKEPLEITNEDTAIASLKTLITDLRARNEVLGNRIDSLSKSARDAVAKQNTAVARSTLRSKKLAETTLARRTATLSQLEEVYSSIEQAADQVEFMHVMEISTGVLRGLNAEVGGVERVDKVVEQLREQMDEVNEVGDVIKEVGKESSVDEMELGEELDAMEREEREKREFYERQEREKREAIEKAEKEERERKEAEETRRRLDELEKFGGEAVVNEGEKEKEEERERPVEETRDGVKRMSLEPVQS